MCKKICYDGMEIHPFTSEEPVTFGSNGKPMVVANEDSRTFLATVLAYLPGRSFPVITERSEYKYCAEIPDEPIQVNGYFKGNPMLVRGKVSTLMSFPNGGKTEALCMNCISACQEGYTVLYLALEMSEVATYKRLARLMYHTDNVDYNTFGFINQHLGGKLTVTTGKVHMTTEDAQRLIENSTVKPDLVIVDYYSLLVPQDISSNASDRRRATYAALIDIARKYDVAILTAESVHT